MPQYALDALRRYGLNGQPTLNNGVSQSVQQHAPGNILPFVAGPGENQGGLNFLHALLKGPNEDFQMAQQQDTEEQWRQAQLGGDVSPMAAAQKAEELKKYVADAPVRAQETAGRYGVQQQQAQSAGLLDVEKERQRGALDVQNNYGELQKALMGNTGGRQVSGMTFPSRSGGGGSVRFSSPSSSNLNPLLNQITSNRFAAERSLGRKWSWDGPTPEEKTLTQSINNFLLQYPTSPDVKDVVRQVLSDPSYANMTNEDIVANAVDDHDQPIDDASKQQIFELLSSFR